MNHLQTDDGAPHDEHTAEEVETPDVTISRMDADDGCAPTVGALHGDGNVDAVREELAALTDAVAGLDDAMTVLRERVDLIGREVDDVWMELHGPR